MARARTSRRQEALFVPFVAPADEPHLFVVKVREGDGAFFIATAALPRRLAFRRLREMREAMFRAYLLKETGVSRLEANAAAERRYLDGLRDGREGRASHIRHIPYE